MQEYQMIHSTRSASSIHHPKFKIQNSRPRRAPLRAKRSSNSKFKIQHPKFKIASGHAGRIFLSMFILLTGCAGFIGARTTELLLDAGHQVLGIEIGR